MLFGRSLEEARILREKKTKKMFDGHHVPREGALFHGPAVLSKPVVKTSLGGNSALLTFYWGLQGY